MPENPLFEPCVAGELELSHRVVLAPLTRTRADGETLAPTAMGAGYYAQRTSAGGLLITEATHISPEATPVWTIYETVREDGGHVPGIWTEQQTRAWQTVTRAVHAKGGKIVCQLLHAGRIAQPRIAEHPLVKGTGCPLPPVSSSATPLTSDGTSGDYTWDQPATPPRALSTKEIRRLCHDYQSAGRNALAAGFDGVEIHAAHGYLIDQFLCDGVNKRTDRYGGSVENRCRLLFEIVEALVHVMGSGRVGVRLSPTPLDPASGKQNQVYFGTTTSDPDRVYGHAVEGLNRYPLAYVMLTEPRIGGLSGNPADAVHPPALLRYRKLYRGVLMGAGGFTPHSAAQAIRTGAYDLIAFGRWFIANPDLPERLRQGHDLNVYDRQTFYGTGAGGYTDYPAWDDLAQMAKDDPRRKYPLMAQSRIGNSLRNAS